MKRESRDRRLARALLGYMSTMPPGIHKPRPSAVRFSPSNYEDDWDLMADLAKEAHWAYRDTQLRRVFAYIVGRLWRVGIVERHVLPIYDKVNYGEPNWVYTYHLLDKWLARLNPAWQPIVRYSPGELSTPEFEMNYALRRAFPRKDDYDD